MKKSLLIILGICVIYLGYLIQNPNRPYSDAVKIADHRLWYSMQWQGNKVGYVSESWSQQAHYLQWTQKLKIEGIARGKPFSRVSQESMQFSLDYPYPLISGSWYVDSKNQNQNFSFIVKQNEIEISQSGKLKNIAYTTLWDAQQLWAPQREAVKSREQGGYKAQLRQWDMQQLVAKNIQFSFGKMDEFGIIQAASHQQQQVAKKLWRFNSLGKLLSKSLGGALKLKLSTEQEALKLTITDVYQSSLLDLDQPLGEVIKISDLELEIGEPWQQLSRNEKLITQQTPGNFLQIGSPGSYEQQSSKIFLQASIRYPQTKRVKRMAKGLITLQDSNYLKAQSILNFVSEYIDNDDQISELSVDEILDNPKGDCTEHALLFVTLARAVGLPAREVNGLLYLGDLEQKYSAHVWAEVEVDGHWLSVDPTWRKMDLDPGYIRVFGESASDTTTLLALSGKTIHVKALSF